MTDRRNNFDLYMMMDASVIIIATLLFAAAAWTIGDEVVSVADGTRTDQPEVVRFLPAPDPQPARPSYLIDWPMSYNMVPIDQEEAVSKRECADEGPNVEDRDTQERNTRRHHRRWRRHY